MTLALFDLTVPVGSLPVGGRFTYDGWADGVVTANDGHTHTATLRVNGHRVATLEARNPGEQVTPA